GQQQQFAQGLVVVYVVLAAVVGLVNGVGSKERRRVVAGNRLGRLFRQVEGIHRAAENNIVRLGLDAIHGVHRARVVNSPFEVVELGQELTAVIQAVARYVEPHVLLQRAAGAGNKRGVRRADRTGRQKIAKIETYRVAAGFHRLWEEGRVGRHA